MNSVSEYHFKKLTTIRQMAKFYDSQSFVEINILKIGKVTCYWKPYPKFVRYAWPTL
jgi:hypothetical protein